MKENRNSSRCALAGDGFNGDEIPQLRFAALGMTCGSEGAEEKMGVGLKLVPAFAGTRGGSKYVDAIVTEVGVVRPPYVENLRAAVLRGQGLTA